MYPENPDYFGTREEEISDEDSSKNLSEDSLKLHRMEIKGLFVCNPLNNISLPNHTTPRQNCINLIKSSL